MLLASTNAIWYMNIEVCYGMDSTLLSCKPLRVPNSAKRGHAPRFHPVHHLPRQLLVRDDHHGLRVALFLECPCPRHHVRLPTGRRVPYFQDRLIAVLIVDRFPHLCGEFVSVCFVGGSARPEQRDRGCVVFLRCGRMGPMPEPVATYRTFRKRVPT